MCGVHDRQAHVNELRRECSRHAVAISITNDFVVFESVTSRQQRTPESDQTYC